MITALTRIGWYATFALMCTYTAGLAHLSAPAPKRAARQAVQAPAAQPDTAVSPWICCRADLQVIHIHTSTPTTKATIEMACIENASAAGVPACCVCSLPPSAVRLPGMTAASAADGAVVASPIAPSHSANPYAPQRGAPLARRKHPCQASPPVPAPRHIPHLLPRRCNCCIRNRGSVTAAAGAATGKRRHPQRSAGAMHV